MFPYPSGAGLHVGHPLGYIGTDVYARFMRMSGHNVLHAMGYDAFGLPAEQYAVQTGQHPRVTTEANIANMRRQLRALGLGHDPRRGVATTDVDYYRWTQWIFLQIFNSWYDDDAGPGPPDRRARSPSSRPAPRAPESDANPDGAAVARARRRHRARAVVDSYRLAYLDEAPVNWCPALGTVLANEEVTADGRSERGNHPVFRRPLKQWMLRITAYADRLLADLDLLDWPESIKLMQRNWIGRSVGAEVALPGRGARRRRDRGVHHAARHAVRRHLHGARARAPAGRRDRARRVARRDSPFEWRGTLRRSTSSRPRRSRSYREFAAQKSELERQAEGREKTGVFTGAFANNPTNGWNIPVFIADYVLMGYGTGAIMAVPAHDERDFEFADEFELPIVGVVRPPDAWFARRGLDADAPATSGPRRTPATASAWTRANDEVSLDGLRDRRRQAIASSGGSRRPAPARRPSPTSCATGCSAGSATGASRSRSSTTPTASASRCPESMLPVELPEITDFEPRILADDDTVAARSRRSARADDWVHRRARPRRRRRSAYRRETNTMPQWAGSCWYYLRYLDPTNDERARRPRRRAVLDGRTGDRSGRRRPLRRRRRARGAAPALRALLAQGAVRPRPRVDARAVPPALQPGHDHRGRVHRRARRRTSRPRRSRSATARGSTTAARSIAPRRQDGQEPEERGRARRHLPRLRRRHAAALRDVHGPARRRAGRGARSDIIGVHRFLQRFWRNVVDEDTGELHVVRRAGRRRDAPPAAPHHRRGRATTWATLEFNTAIAALIELNNRLTQVVPSTGERAARGGASRWC